MYPSSSVILPCPISAFFSSFYFLIILFILYSLISSPLSSLFRGRALMTEMGMRTEPWIWAGLEGWGRAVEAQCWPPCSPCHPSGRPCSTATATRWAQQTAGTCLWTTPRSNAWTRTTRRYLLLVANWLAKKAVGRWAIVIIRLQFSAYVFSPLPMQSIGRDFCAVFLPPFSFSL